MASTIEELTPEEYHANRPVGKNREGDLEYPVTSAGTLVRKWQQCGKGCRTCSEGKGHEPYWWRVKWNKLTKKNDWKYVGKIVEE